ncbi:MAG TPA: hypothetical protein VFY49_00575 [Myxococcota bacterium]|nr:hypothetical protein [Myxococcota bacterium]
MAASSKRREPWPFAVAAALLSMIAACLAFLAIALANPDPPVALEPLGLRPYEGHVAPAPAPPGAETR